MDLEALLAAYMGRVPIRHPHLRYLIAMALPPLSDVTILRQVEVRKDKAGASLALSFSACV
jgi:hypothetical protein